MHQQHLGRGIVYAIIAAFLFATLGAVIKLMTLNVPPPLVVFGRQLFSLLAISPYIAWWTWRGGARVIHTERFGAHVARALISISAGYCVVFTLWMLPLPDAITLSYTRPLFLPLVIWIWLRKRMELPVWIGLLLGFFGVALILKPGATGFEVGTFIGLASGLLGSIAVLLIRRLSKTEPPARILLYYFGVSTLVSIIPLFFVWEPMSGAGWLGLLGIGVLGAVYQLFLTLAYRNGRATLVSAVLYIAVAFTLVWNWIIWRGLPDWWSIGGIILICGGAIIALVFSHSRAAPGEQPAGAPDTNST